MNRTFEQLKENITKKTSQTKNALHDKFVACSEFLSDRSKLIDVSKKAGYSALAVLTMLGSASSADKHINSTYIDLTTSAPTDAITYNVFTNNKNTTLDYVNEFTTNNSIKETTTRAETTTKETTTHAETTTKVPFNNDMKDQYHTPFIDSFMPERDEEGNLIEESIDPRLVENSFNVMSFNIEMDYLPTVKDNPLYNWENRKEHVVKIVKEENPDIIGFQEITPTMHAYLKEQLDEYDVSYFYRRNTVKTSFSTAIYYKRDRFEELDDGKFWLSPTPNQESNCWDGDIRTCGWEVFRDKKTGNKFCVMNTHYTLRSKEAMNKSSELINKKVTELGLPTIIMGDFNSNVEYDCYKTTTEVFDDSSVVANDIKDFGPTFNGYDLETHGHKKPIDFIFVTKGDPNNPDWTVLSYELLDDHYENYINKYGKPFSEEAAANGDISYPSDHTAISAHISSNDLSNLPKDDEPTNDELTDAELTNELE